MTATDELRRMLDERGVEWESCPHCSTYVEYKGEAWRFDYDEPFDQLAIVCLSGYTPAQAIEATLGRGTCHNLAGQDEYGEWGFCCSECGARPKYDSGEVHIPSSGELPDGTVWLGDSWVPWSYCPNCGARCVG